jgi:hypothetical protein
MIWRALSKAGVPSLKEPHGLSRLDGKRPDGLTLIPWHEGRSATWDVTVTNTVATSYLSLSSISAASAAENAAQRKEIKYSEIMKTHLFYPLAFETLAQSTVSVVSSSLSLGIVSQLSQTIRAKPVFCFNE